MKACANSEDLFHGELLHHTLVETVAESERYVVNTLIDMYGKCGQLKDARSVFDRFQHRNVITWTCMIACYAQHQKGPEAIELFQKMHEARVESNKVTFVNILKACSTLAAWNQGRKVHIAIVEGGFHLDLFVGSALVDMYGKHGNLEDAFHVFSKAPHTNVISWNAIISVFAQNGCGSKSLDLFDQMQRQSIKPDYTTFISVLTACSHAGLVNLGWYFFVYMGRNYGISITIDHCCCMIDLLGRAGHLEEAEYLLNKIPLEVDDVTWRSLLGACKIHSDIERGIRIANRCLSLHPVDAAPYVTLLNIHAASGNEIC